MGDVVFQDSSVLFNLLDVPGRNGERTAVVAEFKRLKDNEATFVFPVTAVIETGNAIAQLADGHSRRTCMERFVEWLRRALTATVPMAVSGVPVGRRVPGVVARGQRHASAARRLRDDGDRQR